MIGFDVFVNGEKVCTAGVGDLGVLSANLSWVRRSPESSQDGETFEEELSIEVGGLSNHEHLRWLERALAVGDRVTLTVVETHNPDPPRKRIREDPAMVEESQRRYFEYLRKKFGDDVG